MEQAKFHSVSEGVGEFFRLTKALAALLRTGYRLPPTFREQICLTVTYANACGP